jgi:hypothetical protein
MNMTLENKSAMKINHHQFTLDSPRRERLWEEHRRYWADYCLNRYQWYNYPRWRYVAPFPLHVDFEASSRCNLSCSMCFRHHIEDPQYTDMDFGLFQKGIDECAANNLYSIRLSWRGECTLNPRLFDMIAYAKQAGIKEVSLLTNGSLLDKPFSHELIRAGLDYLTVSVDGPKHHYNKLRAPLDFDQTKRNIAYLYEARNKMCGYPRIKVQGIWTYIKEDVKGYYNQFVDITDKINFNPEHDYALRDVPQDADFVCQFPWQRISITSTGLVPLCIADWNNSILLGNLAQHTIKEIWLGELMENHRRLQVSGRRLEAEPCQRCHRPSPPPIGDQPQG